jgi:glycosyltransferase involved in cell wall biosynthesis
MASDAAACRTDKLRVYFFNYWYQPDMASLADVLATYYTLARWAQAVSVGGAEVTVFQRFGREERLVQDGVNYVLVKDIWNPQLNKWQIPWSLHRAVRSQCFESSPAAGPVVIHFNGLLFPLQLWVLRAMLPRRVPIVVQHHAEKPARGLRRQLQKRCLRVADGFFFSARELALPWIGDGLILGRQPVYELMEGSTDFCRQERSRARAETGITGDPVVLWVGRLIGLKDPLTVLSGFEHVLQQVPNARLHMVYTDDDLLPEVRSRVAGSSSLSASVTLWGSVPHARLEFFFNSADYFVLGSHYEGSGYALAEALACGVVPVVTDISSFRVLTDGGRIGACWMPGDASAFAAAFLRVLSQPIAPLSDHAVGFFRDHFSFSAIARKAIDAYHELALRRAGLEP